MAGTDELVIWHSQPVKPGQTVMLYGGGLSDVTVHLQRLEDDDPGLPGETDVQQLSIPGQPSELIQPRETAVKVVLPSDQKPGVFALKVQSGHHTQMVYVNAPEVWWARGSEKMDANPGGEFRVFGLGLGWAGVSEALAGTPPKEVFTRIVLKGPKTIELTATEADLYSARAFLPEDMPAGDYEVWVHNGCGGPAGWGKCSQVLPVRQLDPWPDKEYNVLRYGAIGDGETDETDAVQKVLDMAGKSGGGVVYFPSGEYRFSRTLTIPRQVMVRGAGKESTLLYWANPHFELIRSVIRGECHFGLENMTIWYVGAQYGINNMSEVDKKPGGGNALYSLDNRPPHWQEGDIILRGVVIRWQPYVGRPGWGQLNDRLELYRQLNAPSLDAAGTGVAVWLCGRDVRIEDCDIMSGGFPLLFSFFSDGSVVRNSKLYIGSGGLVWASRGRQCIWENNQMLGGETSRAGWSTKANPYYDQNYVRGNTVAFAQTADYEIFGSDGSSPVYYGKVKEANGTKMVLSKPIRGEKGGYNKWNWGPEGHLVFVLHGKGKGQARWVLDGNDTTVEVDRPWTIPLDETSTIGINHSLRQWLIVGNRFADGSSMQLYGLSYEVIFAENELERVGGSEEASLRFLGFQHVEGPEGTEPSYFCQMLGNQAAGSRLDPRRFQSGGNAIELHGGDPPEGDPLPCLMTAAVIRGNHVRSGPIRIVTNSTALTFRAEDIIIEDNNIADSPEGIYVGGKTAGIVLRNNQMDKVRVPLTGAGIPDVWIEEKEKFEYLLQAVEGILKRLSIDHLVNLGPIHDEALMLSGQDDCMVQWEKLKQKLAETISKNVPPPHHPDLAFILYNVRIVQTGGGSIYSVLDKLTGGTGSIDLSIANSGNQSLKCSLEPEWPAGWQANPSQIAVPPNSTVPFSLKVTIPKGCWGVYSFPARIKLSVGKAVLSWDVTLTAGRGMIGDWLVLGPELKGPYVHQTWSFNEIPTASKPAFVLNRPDQWDFSKPIRLGEKDYNWISVKDAMPLALSKYAPAPPNAGKNEVIGAYALCMLEADTDQWIELTATHDQGAYTHELQFYLDGEELQDLRLGRETWPPKRLPVKITKGRHIILVSGRNKYAAPYVSLSVRELGVPSGGHIKIVTP